MKRYLAKFYNEIKQRPVKIPEDLKHNLRNSSSVQANLRKSIKEFRSQLPLLSLAEIAKASKAHIKAYYDIPNLLSPSDPVLEKGLKKHLIKDVINPFLEVQREYFEDRLFVMDKSIEARRNHLLTLEAEKVEAAIRANKEKIRLENLQNLHTNRITPQPQVEDILDGEINTQLVEADTHTLISYKGVVKLNSLPGKRPRFIDLTNQELNNYICYNLSSVEQALQLFENSLDNPNFTGNTKSRLLQKIALLKKDPLTQKRLEGLINSINIEDLSKKNLCNSIWALSMLYKAIPNSILGTYKALVLKFKELIPVCNSMNLAYVCYGLKRFGEFDEDISNKILDRFLELIDDIEIPSTPKDFNVPHINIPMTGHSLYFGSKDFTVPTTKTPAYAMFKVLEYMQNTSPAALPYLYKRCAQLINSINMFELDKTQLIQGISVFNSAAEGLKYDPDIKDCILNMAQLVLKYYDGLSIKEVNLVCKAVMDIRGFKYTSWFKLLALRAFECVENTSPNEFLDTVECFTRYFVAVSYGRDLQIEPFAFLFDTFPVADPLIDKFYRLGSSMEMPNDVRSKVAVCLGLMGYSAAVPIENTLGSFVAASVQGLDIDLLKKIDLKNLISMVGSSKNYDDISKFVAVAFKHRTSLKWTYFYEFYNNNKQFITSQPSKIAFIWALKKNIQFEYEDKLLTVTEKKMIDEINKHNKKVE